MSDLLLLSDGQMRRIEPYLPLSHGAPRVDDRLILSGIFSSSATGCDGAMSPGNMARIRRSTTASSAGAGQRIQPDFGQIDRQARQTRTDGDRRHPFESPPHRSQSAKKRDVPRRIGRTKGGLNSKLHAVCDGHGRPLILLLSEGQMSDYKGAARVLHAFPKAKTLGRQGI